jgi:hypothetical protein
MPLNPDKGFEAALLDYSPRGRGDGLQLRAHGPDGVQTPGHVGGLAPRLATTGAYVSGGQWPARLASSITVARRTPHQPMVPPSSRSFGQPANWQALTCIRDSRLKFAQGGSVRADDYEGASRRTETKPLREMAGTTRAGTLLSMFWIGERTDLLRRDFNGGVHLSTASASSSAEPWKYSGRKPARIFSSHFPRDFATWRLQGMQH